MKNEVNKNTWQHWHIITPSFPPETSRVASWCQNLSHGLCEQRQKVTVWTPGEAALGQWNFLGVQRRDSGWPMQNLPSADANQPTKVFLQISQAMLDMELRQNFLNWWQRLRGKNLEKIVMIHENFFEGAHPILQFFSGKRGDLRFVKKTLGGCDRAFVASNFWSKDFAPYKRVEWMPLCSNVAWIANESQATNLRKAFAQDARDIIGTYGSLKDPSIIQTLENTVPKILENHGDRVWIFIGKESEGLVTEFRKKFPHLSSKIHASGELDRAALSAHIQACDVMLQPYPEGVCSLRTSVLACMYHGKAIVSTIGPMTDSHWMKKKSGLHLAHWPGVESLRNHLECLLADPGLRHKSGLRAREFYQKAFAIENSLERLIESRMEIRS